MPIEMTKFKHKAYKLEDFIDLVKDKKDRPLTYDRDYYYDIYGADTYGDTLVLGMEIYVGDTVQATDDGEEIYPDEVLAKNLSFLYSSENFQAVIDLAVSQNPDVSHEKIVECLNYYDENDDFLDIA
jgi:uncharacterized protein (DUF433 family)